MSCEKYPANRSLDALDPKYRERFIEYLEVLRKTFPQFEIIVTETLRSQARQDCLRKSGASQTVRSNHQDGYAMDIALLRKKTNQLDYRPAVFRNIYRVVDPRNFGLTTGAHLWDGFDCLHIQPIELQGPGKDLSPEMESYEQ